MNDYYELQAKQVLREEQQNSIEFKKFKDDIKEQEKKSDGSNTPASRLWKKLVFDSVVDGIKKELADPEWNRNGEAQRAVKRCLNVAVTYKVDRKTKEKIVVKQPEHNFFDIELGVFITLQLMLDNALCPELETTALDKSTGKDRVCHPAVDQDKLFKKVGQRVELNVAFEYVKECFPRYFQILDEMCEGGKDGQPRSSSYYWRYNMNKALRKKADDLRLEGKYEDAERLEWKPFGSDARHVGAWLVTRVIKYAYVKNQSDIPYPLFQQITRQIGPRTKKTFVVLSEQADGYRSTYADSHKDFIKSDQPMLCPPASAENDFYGHWLLGQNLAEPANHKGYLQTSEMMLTYINRLQNVPYKINPFVLKVMNLLNDKNIGLGKFQPHNYVEPQTVAQSLGLVGAYEDQTDAMVSLPKELVKEHSLKRSKNIGNEIGKVQRGRQSKLILQSANELAQHERFYFPYQWDFRGRAYCRCMTSPQPQGSDYSKACLKFSIEQPLVEETSLRYMSIELANNAGQDKKSFGERIDWVTHNQDKIILVAQMMEPNGRFTDALAYLSTVDEPFQFMAACDEYYHCFIKRDRFTTSLRCGVDMSCSAAGIHSGWKLDKQAAELVNVSPGSKPQDLYLGVWNALLEANKKQSPSPIRPQLLTDITDSGYGRKIAKKMIMVFQYSAGLPKQMEEFKNIHDDDSYPLHLRLTEDEITALWKLWPKATSKVMSVDTVIEWFQKRVVELHKEGKTSVLIPNATGAVQVMKYPLYDIRRIQSFHNGRLTFREPTGEADIKAWKRSILANATHMCDSAILVIGLKDFESSFSTVHDAAYTYATDSMTQMLERLKEGFIEAVRFNIWDEFRKINGLDHKDPTTSFPRTKTLILDDVRDSDYLFA